MAQQDMTLTEHVQRTQALLDQLDTLDMSDDDVLLAAITDLRNAERAMNAAADRMVRGGLRRLLAEARKPVPASTARYIDERRVKTTKLGVALGSRDDADKPMPRGNVTRYLTGLDVS